MDVESNLCNKNCAFDTPVYASPELLEGLTSVALFEAVVYGKFWFQVPLAHLAAFNDLIFLRKMNHCPHEAIRAAGTKSMLRHLWYFSERLVASAFFDDRVSNKTKESMAKNLQRNPTTTNLARLNGKDFDCTLGLKKLRYETVNVLF